MVGFNSPMVRGRFLSWNDRAWPFPGQRICGTGALTEKVRDYTTCIEAVERLIRVLYHEAVNMKCTQCGTESDVVDVLPQYSFLERVEGQAVCVYHLRWWCHSLIGLGYTPGHFMFRGVEFSYEGDVIEFWSQNRSREDKSVDLCGACNKEANYVFPYKRGPLYVVGDYACGWHGQMIHDMLLDRLSVDSLYVDFVGSVPAIFLPPIGRRSE